LRREGGRGSGRESGSVESEGEEMDWRRRLRKGDDLHDRRRKRVESEMGGLRRRS